MPSELPKETLDLLNAFTWEEKIPRLLDYALGVARKKRWRAVFDGQMPEGKEIEDVVSTAIVKVLSGERVWDPQKQPDLYEYLKSVIDSDLYHLCKCEENNSLIGEADVRRNPDRENPFTFDDLPGAELDPETLHILKELNEMAEKFFFGFYDYLDGKPVLQGIIECIDDDVTKSADIAERLGVHVKEIYNCFKQLRRKLEDFRKTWNS
ncbi:hypothetical protein GSUET_15120 [Geobacter sulfurreducens subsp. ethanolicus]|uniref:hypothetical protein n=1 Tax=Geobacter sulfurreducens TaxID=35554 RepID=UPI00257278DC|nr:hypothetical protein [Geobacter sulfurreducens]BEH09900.1 hypothetical protein GSUET_15120 [Geobacter sulfurreducens subsp. ethanolicus]